VQLHGAVHSIQATLVLWIDLVCSVVVQLVVGVGDAIIVDVHSGMVSA
jgi:hypothetical protein